MKTLIGKKKKFFKANLHCHSTLSDGKWTIEKIKEEYKKHGYSIVAFSDHDHLINHSYLNDEDFLALVSAEIMLKEDPNESSLGKTDMKVTHFNAFALNQKETITPCYDKRYDIYSSDYTLSLTKYEDEYRREFTVEGKNELIKKMHEKGFIVSYNHPSWSLEDEFDYINYENIDIVEIYNGNCMTNTYCDDEHVFEDMLRHGKKVYCMCTDDNHNSREDSFLGWVNIEADNLEYNEIINAIKNGEFYASTGPEIYSLKVDGERIKIETSPVKEIGLCTKGRRAPKITAKEGEFITSAEFDIKDNDGYFRLRVIDTNGKRAYTQAYFLDQLK